MYKPVPFLIVASFWYLVLTSLLMVGQYYVERYFSRGVGDRPQVQKPSIETGVIKIADDVETIVPPHQRPGGGA